VKPELTGMASGLLNAGQYMGSGLGAVTAGTLIDALGWKALALTCAIGPLLTGLGMFRLIGLTRN
jgi:predicted MFS family arabinose efflux permease